MKIFGYIVLVILVLTGLKLLMFPVHVVNKTIETGYGVVDKTLNADNAIYNYEWFKQKYEDINASKVQLLNTKSSLEQFKLDAGDRKSWSFEDKNEYSRLTTIYLGQQNYIESLIADYNARTKMSNRNLFSNGLIPNVINSTTFLFKN